MFDFLRLVNRFMPINTKKQFLLFSEQELFLVINKSRFTF